MKKALTASVAIRALFVSKINSRSGLLNVACLDVTADIDPVVSLLTDLPLAAVSEDLLAEFKNISNAIQVNSIKHILVL